MTSRSFLNKDIVNDQIKKQPQSYRGVVSENLNQLKEILGEVSDLNHAIDILDWDRQVNMPPGGSEARGHHRATLGKIAHEKATSQELGNLLDALKDEFEGSDSEEEAIIRLAIRNYDKSMRLPASFVAEHAMTTSRAFDAWQEARSKSDFSIFRPQLEKIVELKKKYISFFPQPDHPYDILLDDYEPGLKTVDVQKIFDDLRPKQVALVKTICESKQVEDGFLHKKYNEEKLWKFSEKIIARFGYEFSRGRQDKAPHPFQAAFSVNDVRITNRFESNNPFGTIFGAMHEAGHAMYEQGINPSFERTPLENGVSMAIHESQSRMWENLVGRSLPFWEYFLPELKKVFPSQLDGVTAKTFYRGVSKVEPSLIRVNADEATYNLHIMLRLEIEIGMVDGSIIVNDLPEIWNSKVKDYLGIVPPNDAHGVLQDIHWASGMLGYFCTYALGNIISAQLWETINHDIPDLDEQIRLGRFEALLDWLRKHIHIHGRKFDPQDLIQMVTGSRINSDAYIHYLTRKYGEIYQL